MGLFDSIKCKYPLPRPQDPMELVNINFNDLDYQTKDLDETMSEFELREDGTIWKEEHKYKFIAGDPNGKSFSDKMGHMESEGSWWTQVFPDVIIFYDSIIRDEFVNDYWIEYKAFFSKGVLTSIEIAGFEAEDNSARKARAKMFVDKMKTRETLWNKWYMKFIYHYYDKAVGWIFRAWRRLTVFVSKHTPSAYTIENWFRPL